MQIEHSVPGWPGKEPLLMRVEADSVGEFIERAQSAAGAKAKMRNGILVSETARYAAGQERWAGEGCAALTRWLSEGRPETLTAIESMKERLATEAPAAFAQPAPRRRRVRGLDCGEEADLDRFARRDLQCWEEMRREAMPRRMVTLGVPLGASSAVRPEQMRARGAAGVALADWLGAQGYAVRIVGYHLSARIASEQGGYSVETVELKRSNAPLDIAAVATAACETAFVRCAILPSLVRCADFALNSCLGYPADPTAEQRAFLGLDIVVPESACYGNGAARWLSETVTAIQAGDLLNPEGKIAIGAVNF
jgi:hypothetical protein